MSSKFPDSLDYVLIGSSRCVNHLQPRIIDSMTGLVGLNLGYASSGPVEINLMVKHFLKNAHTKHICIQVDENYNIYKSDPMAIALWLPLIHEDYVYQTLLSTKENYFWKKNIPFYRYQLNDPSIGFREVGLKLLGREANYLSTGGYRAVHREMKSCQEFIDTIEINRNPFIDEVISLCALNDIRLTFFTAPVYKSNTNYNDLSQCLPNYYNFSKQYFDVDLFADNKHLNHKGSTLFTNEFSNQIFNNKNLTR